MIDEKGYDRLRGERGKAWNRRVQLRDAGAQPVFGSDLGRNSEIKEGRNLVQKGAHSVYLEVGLQA